MRHRLNELDYPAPFEKVAGLGASRETPSGCLIRLGSLGVQKKLIERRWRFG